MSFVLKPIAIGAVALSASLASAQTYQVRQATGGSDPLYAAQLDGAIVVGRTGSESTPIEAPRGADVYSLVPAASGWLLGGHLLDDGGLSDLLLVRRSAAGVDLLPIPDRAVGAERGQPVPLVEDGELVAVAWVEGRRQRELEVWVAEWTEGAWSKPALVSGPGPGSQLALTGTVLRDGRRLLVWTRFDGGDDETVFSLGNGSDWSRPERIHEDNQVPDITPTVVAVDGGAVVAWSWFDGNDYRVRTALFDGISWSLGETLGGKGSLYPSLIATESGAQLLFESVVPKSWTVVDIEPSGRLARQASSARRRPERPLLTESSPGEAALVWLSDLGALDVRSRNNLEWRPAE